MDQQASPQQPQPVYHQQPQQQQQTGYPPSPLQQPQPVYHQQPQQQQQTGYPPSSPQPQSGYSPGGTYQGAYVPQTPQPEYQQVPLQPQQQNSGYVAPQNLYINDWQYPIFDCFNPGELCVNALICPCIVFGKTSARIQDPSLSGYDTVNSDCFICAFFGLCGVSFIYQAFKRREIRNHFSLKGDEVEDFLLSACCPCCAIVQQEKEVIARQHAMGVGLPQHNIGVAQGYKKPEGMAMPGNS